MTVPQKNGRWRKGHEVQRPNSLSPRLRPHAIGQAARFSRTCLICSGLRYVAFCPSCTGLQLVEGSSSSLSVPSSQHSHVVIKEDTSGAVHAAGHGPPGGSGKKQAPCSPRPARKYLQLPHLGFSTIPCALHRSTECNKGAIGMALATSLSYPPHPRTHSLDQRRKCTFEVGTRIRSNTP